MLKRKFWKQENVNFVLGLEKQHYFWWIWKSLQFDYVRGHEIAWHLTHVSCHLISIQIISKNVKFWYSLKVKLGFLILLINLKTGVTQLRVGVGRQRSSKVGEARTCYGKRETLPHPHPPPQPNSFLEFRFKENVSILEQIMSAVKYPCIFPHQIENFVHLTTSSLVNS